MAAAGREPLRRFAGVLAPGGFRHRDPFTVYRSFLHDYDTAGWYTYLQKPDLDGLEALLLARYRVMYDAYFAERALIPAGRLVDLAFTDLEADPIGQIANLYETLDLPGFSRFAPKLARYCSTLAGYRKNRYEGLPEETRRKIAAAWERSFAEWGYPTGP